MKPSVAVGVLCLIFVPCGLLCLAWTVVYMRRTEYLSAIVTLGFAVFSMGFVGLAVIVASGKVTPRVANDSAETVVRPDRRADVLLMMSTVGLLLGMVFYGVFAPLDKIALSESARDTRYLAVFCLVGALVGVLTLRQMLRQRGTSCVRIRVDGLVMGNTMTSVTRSWDEVTSVEDRPRNGRHPTGTTYIVTADGQSRVIPTDWYTPGGHDLRELLRFYWEHPGRRGEVEDGRAGERLESGLGSP